MEAVQENAVMEMPPAPPDDRLQRLQQCLQAVSLEAVEGPPSRIRFFENGEERDPPPTPNASGDHSSWVNQFIGTMEKLAQSASKISYAHVRELRTTLSMMAETIALLADAAKGAVTGLSTVESKLDDAAALEDLRELRGRLEECLTTARSQSDHLRQDLERKIETLQDSVERAASADPDHPSDPTTGLPGRHAAEKAIAEKITGGQDWALAVLVVDRLAFLNSKFGRAAGDEVLLSAARHIAQSLPREATLFRWSGPAFVALLETRHGFTAAERHVKKATLSRLEQTVDAGGRSVLLTIGRSHRLWRLASCEQPDAVYRALDDHIAVNSVDATSTGTA
jgi:GGDEF domain-containing protein